MKHYKVTGRTDCSMFVAANNKKEALQKFKDTKGDLFDEYLSEQVAKKDLPKGITISSK